MMPNVLVVEDNVLLVQLYRSMFRSLGCSVTHAPTRTEALWLLRDSAPALIVLDDRLPDGWGFDTLREIRSRPECADTPIIATLSQPQAVSRVEEEAGAFTSIITKPINVRAFSVLVRRHLRACSESRATAPQED